MNQWVIGILAVGAFFAGFIAFLPPEPVLYQDTYYGKLKAACSPDDNCCIGSVKNMEAGSYKLAENKSCPDGFQRVAVKCPTAYSWCEPKNDNPVPLIGGNERADCPQWTPYPPGWCADGIQAPGELDENGCRGPEQCLQAPVNKSAFFQGQVRNGQDINLTEGRFLRIMIGSRCGGGTDGNGGCSFGGYEFNAYLYDAQGKYVSNVGADENDFGSIITENTDFETFGIRIIFESFGPVVDEQLTGNIKIFLSSARPDSAEVADAAIQAVMVQGDRVEACGYAIYLAELGGATGSRSDWRHTFEIQKSDGDVIDTLTTYGNQEHELQSQKAQNVRIIVKSIQETPKLQANVVFDCNR